MARYSPTFISAQSGRFRNRSTSDRSSGFNSSRTSLIRLPTNESSGTENEQPQKLSKPKVKMIDKHRKRISEVSIVVHDCESEYGSGAVSFEDSRRASTTLADNCHRHSVGQYDNVLAAFSDRSLAKLRGIQLHSARSDKNGNTKAATPVRNRDRNESIGSCIKFRLGSCS